MGWIFYFVIWPYLENFHFELKNNRKNLAFASGQAIQITVHGDEDKRRGICQQRRKSDNPIKK